jgi:hypothetical protein
MARTDSCDVCGRTVTITTDRGEYVARGVEGRELSDGSVRCLGNEFAPDGYCATTEAGERVLVEGDD